MAIFKAAYAIEQGGYVIFYEWSFTLVSLDLLKNTQKVYWESNVEVLGSTHVLPVF
jgi:hypothetical protein